MSFIEAHADRRPSGLWKVLGDVELATLEWVDRHNNRRLHTVCPALLALPRLGDESQDVGTETATIPASQLAMPVRSRSPAPRTDQLGRPSVGDLRTGAPRRRLRFRDGWTVLVSPGERAQPLGDLLSRDKQDLCPEN